jgi:hypothetical protein
MSMPIVVQQLLAQCKVHGSGDAQVMLSDSELYALFYLSIHDLGWDQDRFGFEEIRLPDNAYYQIPVTWFSNLNIAAATPDSLLQILDTACQYHRDYSLYISNLAALHRRRMKYARILAEQPLPNMDQIAPAACLNTVCAISDCYPIG